MKQRVRSCFDQAQRRVKSVSSSIGNLMEIEGDIMNEILEVFQQTLSALPSTSPPLIQFGDEQETLDNIKPEEITGKALIVLLFCEFVKKQRNQKKFIQAIDCIISMISSKTPSIREWCCFALSFLCPKEEEEEEEIKVIIEKVSKVILERGRDKKQSVRLQACITAGFWMKHFEVLGKMLLALSKTDPNFQVRLFSLRFLCCSSSSSTDKIDCLIERTRDINEVIRVESFKLLPKAIKFIENIHSEVSRIQIFYQGITDRSPAVRNATLNALCKLIELKQFDLVGFLNNFDIFAFESELTLILTGILTSKHADSILSSLNSLNISNENGIPNQITSFIARILSESKLSIPISLLGNSSLIDLINLFQQKQHKFDQTSTFILNQLLQVLISSLNNSIQNKSDLLNFSVNLINNNQLSESSYKLLVNLIWCNSNNSTDSFLHFIINSCLQCNQKLYSNIEISQLSHDLILIEHSLTKLDPQNISQNAEVEIDKIEKNFLLPFIEYEDEQIRLKVFTSIGLISILKHSLQHIQIFIAALEDNSTPLSIRSISLKTIFDIMMLLKTCDILYELTFGEFVGNILRGGIQELCDIVVEGSTKIIASGILSSNISEANEKENESGDEITVVSLLLVLFLIGGDKQKQLISSMFCLWISSDPIRCSGVMSLALIPSLRYFLHEMKSSSSNSSVLESNAFRDSRKLISFVSKLIQEKDLQQTKEQQEQPYYVFLDCKAKTIGERLICSLLCESLSGVNEMKIIPIILSNVINDFQRIKDSELRLGSIIDYLVRKLKENIGNTKEIQKIEKFFGNDQQKQLPVEEINKVDEFIKMITIKKTHKEETEQIEEIEEDTIGVDKENEQITVPRQLMEQIGDEEKSLPQQSISNDSLIKVQERSVIILSCLQKNDYHEEQKEIMQMAIKSLGVQILKCGEVQFNSSITHILINDNEGNFVNETYCNESFAIAAALLTSRWIVPMKWLIECVKTNSWVNELDFGGIRIDNKKTDNKKNKPLQGLCIHFSNSFTNQLGNDYSAINSMRILLERIGGALVIIGDDYTRESEVNMSDINENVNIILVSDSTMNTNDDENNQYTWSQFVRKLLNATNNQQQLEC